jgi:hypothetical protein
MRVIQLKRCAQAYCYIAVWYIYAEIIASASHNMLIRMETETGHHLDQYIKMHVSTYFSIFLAEIEISIMVRHLRIPWCFSVRNMSKCSDNEIVIICRVDFNSLYHITRNEGWDDRLQCLFAPAFWGRRIIFSENSCRWSRPSHDLDFLSNSGISLGNSEHLVARNDCFDDKAWFLSRSVFREHVLRVTVIAGRPGPAFVKPSSIMTINFLMCFRSVLWQMSLIRENIGSNKAQIVFVSHWDTQ